MRKLREDRARHENKLQKSLDTYSVRLIKIVGVIGVVLGFILLIAFWYWVFKKVF